MLYNRCTGIYKFGNNTYPRRIRRRSNLGHIFREKKCILWAGKYGTLRLLAVYVAHMYILSLNLRYGINIRSGEQNLVSNPSSANLMHNCTNFQDFACTSIFSVYRFHQLVNL